VRRFLAVVLCALAAAVAACGGDGSDAATNPSRAFDAAQVYRREAPGVVTVRSVADGSRGQGSGFVISGRGEVVTNAHVVTRGEGSAVREAREVYVEFADDNQVAARIVGTDPDSDVALLRVKPTGVKLRPLALGSSGRLVVGSPVAAMGSPFGEPQSLSVGVISGLDRTIDSLTSFQISDAIQTDAAINRGNSGGPLVNARGEVIGVNSQIRSTGGGGEGVGFAVPVDTVKRSIAALRDEGRVRYAFMGVTSAPVYPQLARRFGLGAPRGAWVQTVTADGPAARAGIRGGTREVRFQAQPFEAGGDVITKVQDDAVRGESDLSRALGRRRPGDEVTVELWHDGERRTVRVTLGERVSDTP
jgi:S1-C subfamily serine protease